VTAVAEKATTTARKIEAQATRETVTARGGARSQIAPVESTPRQAIRDQAPIIAATGATEETNRTKTAAQESAPRKTIDIPSVVSVPPIARQVEAKVESPATTPVSPPASSETIPVAKPTQGKAVIAKSSPAPRAAAPAQTSAASSALSPKAIVAARAANVPAPAAAKPIAPAVKAKVPGAKLGFKTHEFIVYPAHGVGQIVAIETQEVAGFSLELFVVNFIKDKMTLKVPTSKVATVGMRKLAEAEVVDKALSTLSGRARVKRTMWSRRAQEYEAKINSGDLVTIAEVVRDLYRSDSQPEQSYSERQLYEAALDRMAREVAAVRKLLDSESLKLIESFLAKSPRRGQKSEGESESDAESDDGDGDGGDDDNDVERAA
jgi:CarD family transcriptional regulator